MDSLLKTLVASAGGAQVAASNTAGRSQPLQIGVVNDVNDPLGDRRIRVVTSQKGGKVTSDWLYRCISAPFLDPPVPTVGQTVLVAFVEGNPHRGVWLGPLMNTPNPPLQKPDVLRDLWETIPGEQRTRVNKDTTFTVGGTITLRNDAGCAIVLGSDGAVRINDANGHTLTLSGTGFTVDADTSINAGSVNIEGQQVTTIGAVDTAGHTTVSKGW